MTPEPTPSVSTGLLNQSRATALFVMPTTVGPTALAARTTGVLRASERPSVETDAAGFAASVAAAEDDELFAVPAEQPVKVTAEMASMAAMAIPAFLCFLFAKIFFM